MWSEGLAPGTCNLPSHTDTATTVDRIAPDNLFPCGLLLRAASAFSYIVINRFNGVVKKEEIGLHVPRFTSTQRKPRPTQKRSSSSEIPAPATLSRSCAYYKLPPAGKENHLQLELSKLAQD